MPVMRSSPMMLVRMLIELITIMAVEKPVHALHCGQQGSGSFA
jgi:hypothetical protein